MYEIDPSRLDLAREFRANPLGPHSAELTAVLTRMRGLPVEGKHCLIVAKPREKWLLAQISGVPLRPRVVPGYAFSSIEEAEWTVFKLRWRILTGRDLAADLGEIEAPAAEEIAPPDTSRVILAYADTLTAGAGDKVGIKISTPGIESYRADVVRLHAPARGANDAGFQESEVASLGSFRAARSRCGPAPTRRFPKGRQCPSPSASRCSSGRRSMANRARSSATGRRENARASSFSSTPKAH